MKRVGLIICLMSAVVMSGFAQDADEWYQGKPVKDIVFYDLQHMSSAELDGVTSPYVGKEFTDDLFYELIGKLYALEYFDDVTPAIVPYNADRNSVRIQFTVKERPTISRIVFVGNNKIRRGDLAMVVTSKVNDVVSHVKIKADEAAIVNSYIEKGFPSISVVSETTPDKNATVILTFRVNEGIKTSIAGFVFEGNKIFATKTLLAQLSSKAKGLFNDGAFSEAKLIADQESILKYYHDRGYMDARIIDTVRDMQVDKKGDNSMAITFKIFEGDQYRFGGIEFAGNDIFSNEVLSALVRSKKDEIINGSRLETDLQRIADKYYENGYIFNTIDRQETRENGVLSYTINIVERGRAHIESIKIAGNEKTKASVILREIPLETGDVFSRAKIMDGLRNLYNMQFFSNIAPDMQQGSDENLMDLVINVEEQPTMDVQFGITFSGTADPDEFPLSGIVKWTDRNLFGYGNSLGAEVNFSTAVQSISLSYTQRYLLGLPMSVSFDLTADHAKRQSAMDNMPPYFKGDEDYAYPDGFDSYGDYEDAGKIPPDEYLMDYDQWRISLGMSTGYRWPTVAGTLGLGGGVRLGFVYNDYDDSIYRPFDPTIRDRNNQWTPSNSIWLTSSLDRRDIYYDPTSGYYINERLGNYGILPIEPEHYIKSDTKVEAFYTPINIPVTEKWSFMTTFGIHSGLAFVFPQYGHEKPVIENVNKLAIDGMFTGRGWSGEYSTKGFAMWENWAELRIPVIPRVLAWDFFFDAAEVQPDWSTFWSGANFVENMRFSLGGGLRFAIPQFPLRLLFAKRFRVIDGDVMWYPKTGMDVVLSFVLSSY